MSRDGGGEREPRARARWRRWEGGGWARDGGGGHVTGSPRAGGGSRGAERAPAAGGGWRGHVGGERARRGGGREARPGSRGAGGPRPPLPCEGREGKDGGCELESGGRRGRRRRLSGARGRIECDRE